MSSISDQIRKWYDICGGIIDSGDKAKLHALVDRIDNEMMELPRDADGVPIHVGDTVYDGDGIAREVVSISFGRWDGFMTVHAVDGSSKWRDLAPGNLTHTYPDSWERIADELDEWRFEHMRDLKTDSFNDLHLFAERIRRLASREVCDGTD